MIDQVFNNREIAAAALITVLFTWLLSKRHLRLNLGEVIKSLFAWKIVTVYVIALLWTSLGIWVLYHLKLWTTSQLKDSVLWVLSVALITLVNANKIRKDKNYFRQGVRDNLKFTLILEFVVGMYTFNLATELILVPAVTMIAILIAVAKTDSKYIAVQKFLDNILVVVGLGMIGYTCFKLATHFKEVVATDTLRDFLLPQLLAVWYLPFIYLVTLYMTYEENYAVLGNAIKDRKLLLYAKRLALVSFKNDVDSFNRWRRELFQKEPSNRIDLIKSVKELKQLQKIEANPPIIPTHQGWSPYRAKDFLLNQGITTDHYTKSFDENWFAIARSMKLDDSIAGNTVSYDVQGTKDIVSELTLVLSVFDTQNSNSAHEKFLSYARALFELATLEKFPPVLEKANSRKEPSKWKNDQVNITLGKEWWINNSGYSYRLVIKHNQASSRTYEKEKVME